MFLLLSLILSVVSVYYIEVLGFLDLLFFFFKQKTAYEIGVRLVGSEMCIRDSAYSAFNLLKYRKYMATYAVIKIASV